MSILNYLKRKSNTLPEPSGTLSNLIPSRAIAEANKEVSNLVHNGLTHGAEFLVKTAKKGDKT